MIQCFRHVLAALFLSTLAAQGLAGSQELRPLPKFPVMICQHRSAGVKLLPEMREHAPLVDVVMPMWYEAHDSGEAKPLKGCEGPYEPYVTEAHELGIRVLPIVRNFAPQKLLADDQAREKLAAQAAELVRNENFDGLLVDMEELKAQDRESLVDLVRQIRSRPEMRGKILGVAVPRNNPKNEVNYQALSEHSDFLLAMFYDYVGPWNKILGPTAPLLWPSHNSDITRDLAAVIKNGMPRERLIFGIPVYGNDFTLGADGQVAQVKAVYLDSIEQLRKKYDAAEQWDDQTRTPFFNYVAQDGGRHMVWYENRQSLSEKVELARREGLQGIGVWAIVYPDRPVAGGFWQVIADLRKNTMPAR